MQNKDQDHLKKIEEIAEDIMYEFITKQFTQKDNKKVSIEDADAIHQMILQNKDANELSGNDRILLTQNCLAQIQKSGLGFETKKEQRDMEDAIMSLDHKRILEEKQKWEELKAQKAKAKPPTPEFDMDNAIADIIIADAKVQTAASYDSHQDWEKTMTSYEDLVTAKTREALKHSAAKADEFLKRLDQLVPAKTTEAKAVRENFNELVDKAVDNAVDKPVNGIKKPKETFQNLTQQGKQEKREQSKTFEEQLKNKGNKNKTLKRLQDKKREQSKTFGEQLKNQGYENKKFEKNGITPEQIQKTREEKNNQGNRIGG